jgi:hypothetical protein
MAGYESPLTYLIKGAVAGAVGTAVMSAAMQRAPQLMERAGVALPKQRGGGAGQPPTAELAERVAEGVLHESIDEEAKAVTAEAVHWGYGAAWGAYYAVIQASFNFPRLLHGTFLGALVAAADVPQHLQVGALRGKFQLLQEEAVELLVEQIRSDDREQFRLGLAVARDLGRDLTDAGVRVVSGLALGIDGAAHRGVQRPDSGSGPR